MKSNEPKFKWSATRYLGASDTTLITCHLVSCPYAIKVDHTNLDEKRRPLTTIINMIDNSVRFKSRSIAAMKLTMRKLYYYEKSKGLL